QLAEVAGVVMPRQEPSDGRRVLRAPSTTQEQEPAGVLQLADIEQRSTEQLEVVRVVTGPVATPREQPESRRRVTGREQAACPLALLRVRGSAPPRHPRLTSTLCASSSVTRFRSTKGPGVPDRTPGPRSSLPARAAY